MFTACDDGQYVCEPDCSDGKECGDDGCSGLCGTCDDGLICDNNQCVACPDEFPNEYEGICWSDLSTDQVIYPDAVQYCKSIGGQLPTVDESRTLIVNCSATEPGGSCGITDSCFNTLLCNEDGSCHGCVEPKGGKFSVFDDVGCRWTSLEDQREERVDKIIVVIYQDPYDYNYFNASIQSNGANDMYCNVRCVYPTL